MGLYWSDKECPSAICKLDCPSPCIGKFRERVNTGTSLSHLLQDKHKTYLKPVTRQLERQSESNNGVEWMQALIWRAIFQTIPFSNSDEELHTIYLQLEIASFFSSLPPWVIQTLCSPLHLILVGDFNPYEKWWSSSDWIIIPAIGEVIMAPCSKPPTRWIILIIVDYHWPLLTVVNRRKPPLLTTIINHEQTIPTRIGSWHPMYCDRHLLSCGIPWQKKGAAFTASLWTSSLSTTLMDASTVNRPGNPQVQWSFKAKINCHFREFSSTPCLITGRIWKVTKKGGAWIPNKETHLRWHLRSSKNIWLSKKNEQTPNTVLVLVSSVKKHIF